MTRAPRHNFLVAGQPYLSPTRPARRPKLTPLQEIELVAWYKAKCALGTWKTKARELDTTERTIMCVVERRLGLR